MPGKLLRIARLGQRMVTRLRGKWLSGFGRRSDAGVVRFGGEIMGTTYHVTVHGLPSDIACEVPKRAVHAALNGIVARMSVYRPDSELSRFNAHASEAPFPVNAEMAEVFRISRRVSEQSGGAFDVTVGPLVDAWGFGPNGVSPDSGNPPIAAVRENVGWQLVEVRGDNTLVKKHPGVHCNLSAVAKGYGVDKAAEALEQLGAGNYLVEVGGEVRTKGVNPEGRRWRLGIERPDDEGRQAHLIVEVSGLSLATSGDYRIFRVEAGKRVCHEIDPRTGCPANSGVASASVIHPSCAWADAYATALMVLNPEDGHAFAERYGLAVCLLERGPSGEIVAHQTKGFREHLTHD